MNNETMQCNQYRNHSVCFLAGVLAGATTALLIAPQAGSRTRRMLREKVEGGAQSVVDAGHELRRQGKRLADGAASFAGRARDVMSG